MIYAIFSSSWEEYGSQESGFVLCSQYRFLRTPSGFCAQSAGSLYTFPIFGSLRPPFSCGPYSDPPSIEFLWGVWQKLAFPFVLWRICSAIPSPELSFLVIPSLMDINESQTYQLNASLCLEDAMLLERTSCVLSGNFAHGDFLKVLL